MRRPPPKSDIAPGDAVWAKDVNDKLLPRRALTTVINGNDFPVVWVCKEEHYDQAARLIAESGYLGCGRGIPWPWSDVSPRVTAEAPRW